MVVAVAGGASSGASQLTSRADGAPSDWLANR